LEGSGTLVAISAGAASLAGGNVGVVRLLGHCGEAVDGVTAGLGFAVLWTMERERKRREAIKGLFGARL